MEISELPGTRSLYRLTNRALAQIRELWQYAGDDELLPDSLLQAQVEALRILHIDVPLKLELDVRSQALITDHEGTCAPINIFKSE
jgi:hypothetical protein